MRIGWPKRCPRCGSREIVDVLYGTPDDSELRDLWTRGKAMLRPGICGDGPPGWACHECGFESKELAEARAS